MPRGGNVRVINQNQENSRPKAKWENRGGLKCFLLLERNVVDVDCRRGCCVGREVKLDAYFLHLKLDTFVSGIESSVALEKLIGTVPPSYQVQPLPVFTLANGATLV